MYKQWLLHDAANNLPCDARKGGVGWGALCEEVAHEERQRHFHPLADVCQRCVVG